MEGEALLGMETRAATGRMVGGTGPVATLTRAPLVLRVEEISRHEKRRRRDAIRLQWCVELADRSPELQHLAGLDRHLVRAHGQTLPG